MVLNDLLILGPSKQRVLAEMEQLREPTMTVLLKQLEDRGWVRRFQDPKDSRAKLVANTPAGRREVKPSGKVLRRRIDRELEELSRKEISAIADGLAPLVRLIRQGISEAPEGDRSFSNADT